MEAPSGPRAEPHAAASRKGRKRAGLGQTLRDLAARARPGVFAPGAPRPAPAPIPDGARFETRSHRGAERALDYLLYTPSGRDGARLPLVVMLHGCTQTPEDFAAGTRMNRLAEAHGFLVAYPAQPPSANPNRCWNWFRPEHQVRGRGEPAAIAGMVAEILRESGGDPDRVFVAGLSAGGAAAAVMAAAYPDVFAAAGVHSGLANGAARDVVSAFAAMRQAPQTSGAGRAIPMIVFHGDSDPTVHSSNGDEIVAQAIATTRPLHRETERGQSPGGRRWTRTTYADAAGSALCETWTVHGAGHAWSGGDQSGSYTDPAGPDASEEMVRFFLASRSCR
jgi:poly(hydroxyalkanoate) depolymerase family esterase